MPQTKKFDQFMSTFLNLLTTVLHEMELSNKLTKTSGHLTCNIQLEKLTLHNHYVFSPLLVM